MNKEKEKQTEQILTFISQAAFMAETLASNLMLTSACSNPSWLACEKDDGSKVLIVIGSVLNEWTNLEGPQNLNKILLLDHYVNKY